MKVLSRTFLVVVLAAIFTLPAAPAAQGAVPIHEGKGVGRAQLGMADGTAVKFLGSHRPTQVDTNYSNRTVYVTYFGKKSGGRYALEMLSSASHRVFMFTCNSSIYVTARGAKAGSTESFLKSKYGSTLKRLARPIYTWYTLGRRPYTQFIVKKSTHRVLQICIAR